jgi:hypothetical protein
MLSQFCAFRQRFSSRLAPPYDKLFENLLRKNRQSLTDGKKFAKNGGSQPKLMKKVEPSNTKKQICINKLA